MANPRRRRISQKSALTCLYCKRMGASVKLSEQHIIPEALGKGPSLKKEVCSGCNHRINQEVERPVIEGLTPLRALLRLEGKRGKAPALPVKVSFRDASYEIREHPDAIGDRLLTFKVTNPETDKKQLAIIGPSEAVQKAQTEHQHKRPKATWEDIGEEHRQVQYQVGMEWSLFGKDSTLRLAGKIAFEWWCRELGVSTLDGYEYDPLRCFVLTGERLDARPLVWVIADEALIRALQPHFGIHSILLGCNPSSTEVLAIVGIFGLVYYKIVLTRHHSVLAPYQKMVYLHPQKDEPYEPQIHARLTNLPIHRYTPLDQLEPMEAIRRISDSSLQRLNAGLREVGIIKELSGVVTAR